MTIADMTLEEAVNITNTLPFAITSKLSAHELIQLAQGMIRFAATAQWFAELSKEKRLEKLREAAEE